MQRRFFLFQRRSVILICASIIIGTVISVMIVLFTPKVYEALSTIIVCPTDAGFLDRLYPTLKDFPEIKKRMESDLKNVNAPQKAIVSDQFLERVLRRKKSSNTDLTTLKKSITIETGMDPRMIYIICRSSDPDDAQNTANIIAEEYWLLALEAIESLSLHEKKQLKYDTDRLEKEIENLKVQLKEKKNPKDTEEIKVMIKKKEIEIKKIYRLLGEIYMR